MFDVKQLMGQCEASAVRGRQGMHGMEWKGNFDM